MKFRVSKDYREARAEQYPTLLEFAEAISERELGDDTKWKAYIKKVKETREKYPKPRQTKS